MDKEGKSGPEARVVKAAGFEYYRLDPIPQAEELSQFYESKYYEQVKSGGIGNSIARIIEGSADSKSEYDWMCATTYADALKMLDQHAPGRRLLEIGAGIGSFLKFIAAHGYEATGIEPSVDAVAIAAARGVDVFRGTLESYARGAGAAQRFDAVVLFNVLEHLPDPQGLVRRVRDMLVEDGVLLLCVPNDFSEMQSHAQAATGHAPWWIAAPDHINYFNFRSLTDFARRMGFDELHAQSDFPMELFLLMGEDYIGNPSVGGSAHARRVAFELAVPGDFRRSLYAKFAELGIGRCCLSISRKRS